ncbi:uncharacterized protein YndB with AHSA1/START domain [Caulobacter ginsengisoli]|uniref:Uncharacterized protein YndB with AHSA1/START domain n=1 Tax=Caulobacter ginsengisoli TaxID=400775 RepID=A0ABU0IKZ7_9CAUL|nr:SRPBCC domain-containing protein [Caulobacter ginsengisoli]MDQ0462680.1 uncharacterized protein YndB with AHSA1/START domain [Caulobacter ginsengisoli]
MDPAILVRWLPPGEMRGVIHHFDGRVGGGYEMSLTYPDGDNRGKTTANEDRVRVVFTELDEPHRIVEAVTFVSDDPALAGVMTIEIILEPVSSGTRIEMRFENLPHGIRPEDNNEGARQSLDNLAAMLR